MDSLLATYASSDEEEDQEQPLQHQLSQSKFPSQPASKFGGNFFSSLPPPRSQHSNPSPQILTHTNPNSSVKSLFSSIPQPKTETLDPFSLNPKPKKIVQFRPPITPSMSKIDDEDDEDDEDHIEERKKDDAITEAPSVKSFLSSIPAPRNSGSLGALPSSAGTGRRSILEAQVPVISNSNAAMDSINRASDHQVKSDNDFGGTAESLNVSSSSENYMNYDNTYIGYGNVVANESANVIGMNYDDNNYGPAAPASDDYASYGGYGDYREYESKWIDRSSGDVAPEVSEKAVESVMRVPGKRGRTEIPQEIIEVKQDELMKNRPRADQAKMTGIAFGPSYQPASSAKGKPSKLHKRKHQIGTLYFEMRQKEMELAERRSKGFLTKAETQAKYGW